MTLTQSNVYVSWRDMGHLATMYWTFLKFFGNLSMNADPKLIYMHVSARSQVKIRRFLVSAKLEGIS